MHPSCFSGRAFTTVWSHLFRQVTNCAQAIVDRLPSPADNKTNTCKPGNHLKALLFDSMYEAHRGVLLYVAVLDGKIATGDRITTHLSNQDRNKPTYKVKELGILHPDKEETGVLFAGMKRQIDSCRWSFLVKTLVFNAHSDLDMELPGWF